MPRALARTGSYLARAVLQEGERKQGNAAVNITRYGRVEADLNLIPAPAMGGKGGDSPFAAVLDAAQEPAPRQEPQARSEVAPQEPQPAPVSEPSATVNEAGTNQMPLTRPADELPAQAEAGVAQPSVTTALGGGESGRHFDAGKGTGSPLTSTALPIAADVQPQANAVAGTAAVPVAAAAPVAPVLSQDARIAAANGAGPRSAALRAPAVAAAYRTNTTQSAQMFEQARDSVFKQILMKLGKNGSEMRMRLEPPELGELDVQMSVNKGGQMRLYLGAERPELATMLERNLDALKQTLGQQGFTVVHAEVRDGSRSDRQQWNGPEASFAAAGETQELAGALPRQGWITADGLDFWV